jgi:F-type H+-transporting ATPase subunit c
MSLEAIAMIVGGLTMAIGSIGPALGEARAAAAAFDALARQPDLANTITRTLLVSMALIETTALYCLVVALMLLLKLVPLFEQAGQAAGA